MKDASQGTYLGVELHTSASAATDTDNSSRLENSAAASLVANSSFLSENRTGEKPGVDKGDGK